MQYEKLFSPIKMRGVAFPNRIMRTSMVSGLATEDGLVTDLLKERYRREAKGGAGSIVVEAAVILASRSSFNLRISDDSFIGGLKALVDAIREANPEPKVGLQIMHFLKISRSGWRQKVEDFKPEELPVIVEQHAKASRRAVAAGFDFIGLRRMDHLNWRYADVRAGDFRITLAEENDRVLGFSVLCIARGRAKERNAVDLVPDPQSSEHPLGAGESP